MAHIKQCVPPEQPAVSLQIYPGRDGKTLNLALMGSREGTEEREAGDKRWSVAVTANEREGTARKKGQTVPCSPPPLLPSHTCAEMKHSKRRAIMEGRR